MFAVAMKKILILGAGRSSSSLVSYLLEHSVAHDWHVRVGDLDPSAAAARVHGHSSASSFGLDADSDAGRKAEIEGTDLVISMLPAVMHPLVARDCLDMGKHLITPSYVSSAMLELDADVKKSGLLFLNEMGVDPGIDHMSAMKIVDHIKAIGGTLKSFESFTGGLVAPESDDNPWHYKVTWNPRNVVMAGAGGTASYREGNALKLIPYQRLFERTTPVHVEGYGHFEGYANRDSLKYADVYGLQTIPTLYRGTLRKDGFCAAWNALIQLGLTDDFVSLAHGHTMTWAQLTAAFLPSASHLSLQARVQDYLRCSDDVMDRLRWLGIFEEVPLGIEKGTAAVALQQLIERKWKLSEDDKDMIVMWHRFVYEQNGEKRCLVSSLVCTGDDAVHTAMSKTVGLPIAIAAKLVLTGVIKRRGVALPVSADLYEPILAELADLGITFTESESAWV
jgi:saccharopine dehydrogenase-like NADP-dependent oxidoreductase